MKRSLQSGLESETASFDDRILGSGDFVQSLLENQNKEHSQCAVVPLPDLVRQVAAVFGVTAGEIRAFGRSKPVTDARSAVSYLAYREMGYSGKEIARALGITRSGVCRRAAAGEALCRVEKRLQDIIRP
ncbi:MAG: hypothetical protein BA864_00420 [Desulfuromonadales bacterium C00003093]|nr:MAG: hypothetical protein BA864_00420 [Desulfuromonadales bacterium C00003093]